MRFIGHPTPFTDSVSSPLPLGTGSSIRSAWGGNWWCFAAPLALCTCQRASSAPRTSDREGLVTYPCASNGPPQTSRRKKSPSTPPAMPDQLRGGALSLLTERAERRERYLPTGPRVNGPMARDESGLPANGSRNGSTDLGRTLGELLGQAVDLRSGESAVTAQSGKKWKPSFLGPPGHGLG